MINPLGNLFKKSSLLTRFSLLALIVVIIMAVVIIWSLERILEQDIISQEAHNAVDQVESVFNNNLSSSDLTGPLAPARIEQIDEVVHRYIIHEHVVRVMIRNRSGQILYSDQKELIGQTLPIDKGLAAALDGQVSSDITSPDSEHPGEHESGDQVIMVHAPIQLQGSDEVKGAYEIYHELSIIEPEIAAMRRFVVIIVGLGSLMMYMALFGIVRNASHNLVHTNEENLKLFMEERTRRSELAALYDISRALASALPKIDETLDIIVRRAVETIHSTFASAFIIENRNITKCVSHPVRVLNRSLDNQCVLAASLPFLQKVLEQAEPVIVRSDTATDITESERLVLALDLAKTICLIPIKIEGQATGVLLIGETRSENREPFTPEKLRLAHGIADQTASALQRARLFSDLEHAYLETVLSLANAVEAKDTYTRNHADNVSRMAVLVGKELGLTEKELEDLRFGGILHDVGKIGVPNTILNKPGKLNDEEWVQMRAHAAMGADILKPVPRLAGAADIVRHHHERYDGNGYPDRLVGEDIPIGARILTTIDSYSAMVDRRSYKAARPHEDATAELKRCAGTQFDPRVVDAFLGLFDLGTLVPDEHEARVVEDEPSH